MHIVLENLTFTLPGSKFDKQCQINEKNVKTDAKNNDSTDIKKYADKFMAQKPQVRNVTTQTNLIDDKHISTKITQTDEDHRLKELQRHIIDITTNFKKETERSDNFRAELQHVSQKLSVVNEQKKISGYTIQNLTDSNNQKDSFIKSLQSNTNELKNHIDDLKSNLAQVLQEKNTCMDENRNLLQALKEVENEKNSMITEYNELLKKERQEYAKAVKDLQEKILVMKTHLDG